MLQLKGLNIGEGEVIWGKNKRKRSPYKYSNYMVPFYGFGSIVAQILSPKVYTISKQSKPWENSQECALSHQEKASVE